MLFALLVVGCGGKKVLNIGNPDLRFAEIKKLYERKKYDRVIEEIEVYLIAFSGTAKVDSAQLLLAEAHFYNGEFLLGQAEYERLSEQFPQSPLVEEARYKSALCWSKLSPKQELDQKYTQKALDEFQGFLEEYPQSHYAKDAEEGLTKCREKIAMKELAAAQLYFKMRKYESAILYFDQVIDTYYSTPAEPLAYLGKALSLEKLEDSNGAKAAYATILTKFPGSDTAKEAGRRFKELENREHRTTGRNF